MSNEILNIVKAIVLVLTASILLAGLMGIGKAIQSEDSYKIICIDKLQEKHYTVQYTKNGEAQSFYCTHLRQIEGLYEELMKLGTLDTNGYEVKPLQEAEIVL